MLEKMNEFFNKRLDGYDEHMMTTIESSDVFYPFTADCLPKADATKILDLGCGTGLELEQYFNFNPSAKITGENLRYSPLIWKIKDVLNIDGGCAYDDKSKLIVPIIELNYTTGKINIIGLDSNGKA